MINRLSRVSQPRQDKSQQQPAKFDFVPTYNHCPGINGDHVYRQGHVLQRADLFIWGDQPCRLQSDQKCHALSFAVATK
jgi:hypothetical protein